jgi:hypothetical protein
MGLSPSPARRNPSPRRPVRRGPSLALGLGLGLVALACGARSPLSVVAGDDSGAADATAQDSAPASDVVEATVPPTPPDACADMPPVPCSGGGYQYCVAGHYSACATRCGACVPGSTRVCFMTYCTRWGTQTCASDGLSFGFCEEFSLPSQCAAIAAQSGTSPALEQCCIDNGYCCEDLFDLDGDGNSGDQIGTCGATSC